jgi:hypothetical protein
MYRNYPEQRTRCTTPNVKKPNFPEGLNVPSTELNREYRRASVFEVGPRTRSRESSYFLKRFSKARRASSTELAPDEVSRSTRSLRANFGQSLCRSFLE